MLHDIINEQGTVLMKEMIFQKKMNIFHSISYKSLVFGPLILEIISLLTTAHICYKYFLISIILRYIEIQMENKSVK